MLHHNETNLDVQRLMHEIRASVAEKHEPEAEKSPVPEPTNGHVDHKNHYHVDDLLRFHGDEFVRNAYRTLLGREPDEAGMAQHLEGLASGRFNKIDVLASLHSSPEGRNAQVKLDGLSLPIAVRRLGRVPVVGYFIRLGVSILRLPNFIQHHNRFEFYTWSQQRRIADRQDQHQRELNEALQQISAQILEIMQGATEQQRANELALAQQGVMEERFAEAQTHFDESTLKLTNQLASATEKIQSLVTEEIALVREKIASVRNEIVSLQQSVAEQKNTLNEHETENRRIADQIVPLRLRQEKSETELLMHERRLTVLLEALGRNSATQHRLVTEIAANEDEHRLDSLYAAFEDEFRGPRDEVRRRLQVYIPLLKEAGITSDVLDLGCGRGEWLELLKSESIAGRGVDRNRVFVEACLRANLNVVEEDALAHLRSLAEESLNVVTAFHLVEHVPFEMLINLVDEIARTLRPGGMVILETPNPENFIVGSCSFYADPTHRNPIPSKTLQFLLEARGLRTIEVLKLRSWDEAKLEGKTELVKRFNEYFYSAPDYAVIAAKP
jgi:SAM-dependent methyltransferase